MPQSAARLVPVDGFEVETRTFAKDSVGGAYFYRCRICGRDSTKPYSFCPHCQRESVGEYLVRANPYYADKVKG